MPATTQRMDRLSSSDALMWRIEADPVLRSPVVVVGLLASMPTRGAVRDSFAAALDAIPRLRQRIVGGVAGRLRWEDDARFSLDHHIRLTHAGRGAELRDVLDIAEPDATAPFDPARPPWTCTLVDGLSGRRGAFVLRFHHSITDGVGGIDFAASLFDVRGDGHTATAKPPVAHPVPAPNGWRQASRMASSLRRMLAPVDAPLSPLFAGRGLDRRMDAFEIPLDALRAAADVTDVTLNEAFLSAVAGGLYRYHQRFGHSVQALRFTMPISLRADGDAPGGNRFAPARFVLAIDDPDPRTRARLAADMTRRQRREPALRLTDRVADVLAALPTPVVTKIFGDLLRNIDVDVVDVPGLRGTVYLAGARVDAMFAFAPPTGAALSITLLSHGDACCIGLLCDTTPIAEPALLRECLEGAFDEVLAVAQPRVPTIGLP